MCRLRNIAMRDYQESVTTGQTDGQTDRQTPDKFILMLANILIWSYCIKVVHFILISFFKTCFHHCESLYNKYFYRAMYDWLQYFCGESKGWTLLTWFNQTSGVTDVTPNDRPKSVRNRCVSVWWHFLCCQRCFLNFSVGVGAFVIGLSQVSSFFLLCAVMLRRRQKKTKQTTKQTNIVCHNSSDKTYSNIWQTALSRTPVSLLLIDSRRHITSMSWTIWLHQNGN